MQKPVPLLIATSNLGKQREVRQWLEGLSVELKTLDDVTQCSAPVEDADTFEENAAKKAMHYARESQWLALADDSGLEVDALDGAPGVRSARFAGLDATDAQNNAELLRRLRATGFGPWKARFQCALALASGTEVLATASGCLEGVIIEDRRGENGFGYDPHFFLADLKRTVAELSRAHKNRISHRGKALESMRPAIARLMSGFDTH